MIKNLLCIGVGSFAGGVSRYLLSLNIQKIIRHPFPFETITVNMIGCFIIGMLYGILESGNMMNDSLRLFLIVGFCGSFTTFSTFMNESYSLYKSGDPMMMLGNLLVSIVGGFVLLYIGRLITKGIL